MTTEERVIEVIVSLFGFDPDIVTRDKALVADLGLDNREFEELVLAVECEFDIYTRNKGAAACATVGDFIDLVDRLKGEQR